MQVAAEQEKEKHGMEQFSNPVVMKFQSALLQMELSRCISRAQHGSIF